MEIKKVINEACGSWHRHCELLSMNCNMSNLSLIYAKEEDSKTWKINFTNPVCYKVTSEEFGGTGLLSKLPQDGSFFEVYDSPWVQSVLQNDFQLNLKHFIFCFYEEIIEVLCEDIIFKTSVEKTV